MNKILVAVAMGAVASALAGGVAVAQSADEITVSVTRGVPKVVGHDASGSAIIDVTLSYGVSYAGLDLSSYAGANELKKRVNDAAKSACSELGKQHPLANLSDEGACVKGAADKAMVKVNELIAAAAKKK